MKWLFLVHRIHITVKISNDGFSWRIAVHQQIPYLEQAQVRLAYQSLYKDSNIEITGISLGITYQF